KEGKTFSLELGGRLNNHSEYGNNFSYTINPSAYINNRLKIFSNLYSAFKTPTLYQLFNPFAGNTELTPERSFNFEAGVQWFPASKLSLRTVYFYRKTNDAIEYVYIDPVNYIS